MAEWLKLIWLYLQYLSVDFIHRQIMHLDEYAQEGHGCIFEDTYCFNAIMIGIISPGMPYFLLFTVKNFSPAPLTT